MTASDDQLALATALTQRTKQLCLGLEHGEAEILELVAPATAELLRWWFTEDACQSRAPSGTSPPTMIIRSGGTDTNPSA